MRSAFIIFMILAPLLAFGQEIPPTDRTMVPGERVGPITWNTSEKELAEWYGEENLARRFIKYDNGEVAEVTYLFPGQPDELLIEWADANFEEPYWVTATSDGSWHLPEGLKCGSTREEITDANGRLFSLSGFAGKNAGRILFWKEGKLEKYYGKLYIRLSPSPESPPSLVRKYARDTDFRSVNEDFDKMDLRITEISVVFF